MAMIVELTQIKQIKQKNCCYGADARKEKLTIYEIDYFGTGFMF